MCSTASLNSNCRKPSSRQAKDTELLGWAMEIQIRSARRAGELLAAMEKHPGNQSAERGEVRPSSQNDSLSLKSLGLTRDKSSQWQQLAKIHEPEFEN